MNITTVYRLVTSVLLSAYFLSGCQSTQHSRIYQQISPYSFEETILYLDVAISEHNYRIIHRSEIGQAIRDRGDVDFPLSTITNFCNISYAQEMVLINPDLLNDTPCNIVVREQGNHIIVSTKLMNTSVNNEAELKFATKINQNLTDIINATVE